MRRIERCGMAILAFACATAAIAAPIVPSSYDMRNGEGKASGGSFNYWDRSYSGTGSVSGAGPKTADGEVLTGGRGDLTDGVTTTKNWNDIENDGGTGPYVGWYSPIVLNPVVHFRFGGTVQLAGLTVHTDDSDGHGGVDPPLRIGVSADGVTFAETVVIDPPGSAPFNVDIALGGLTTDDLYVRFIHQNGWVFIDEVSFDGRIVRAPAPGSLALLSIGALGLAALRRSRGTGTRSR